MYSWNWCFNVFHSPSVVIWPALRTSKCRCSKFYTAIYIYIYVCVSYNMSTFYAQHKISTLHLIPSPASAPVVPRASLPTSRWPGVFGTPKTHGLPSVSDGFLLLLKWLAMSEGNCLCSGFLFNLLSVSPLVVCHELWYIPTWQIIYGIGKRKVGKPVEWLYRYPILDKAACWWIFATLSRPTI